MTATPFPYRGPKDLTLFRNHPTDWTGYQDPLPACDLGQPFDYLPNVSSIKEMFPKGHLIDWAARQAAECAAALTGPNDLDGDAYDRFVDYVAKAHIRNRDTASARGHTVHTILETALDGTPITPLDQLNPATQYTDILRQLVNDLKPTVLATEIVAVRKHEYVGTLDAIWDLDGTLYSVDYKSRKEGKAATRYHDEGAQTYANNNADYWIVEGPDGPHRVAPIVADKGLIVSIAPDAYSLYKVDLDVAANLWDGLYHLYSAHTRVNARDSGMFSRAKVTALRGPAREDGDGTASPVEAPPDVDGVTPGREPDTLDNLDRLRQAVKDTAAADPGVAEILRRRWNEAKLPALDNLDNRHTDTVNAAIGAAIDEWNLTDATTPADPPPHRETNQRWTPPDNINEGPPVDTTLIADIRDSLRALPTGQIDTAQRWIVEAQRINNIGIGLTEHPTQRRYNIATAIIAMCRCDTDDALARHLLHIATGHPWADHIPVGAAMMALTVNQAYTLTAKATHLNNGSTLTFDDNGHPIVTPI